MEELRDDLRGVAGSSTADATGQPYSTMVPDRRGPGWGESGIESYEMAQVAPVRTGDFGARHGTPTKPLFMRHRLRRLPTSRRKAWQSFVSATSATIPRQSFMNSRWPML